MITSYLLDFGLIEIFEDYIKVTINEGVTVSPEHNDVLLEMVEKHYKNKAFLYLTHRINSYSVNPTIYLETAKIENLIGFAVVSDNPIQIKQTKLEKAFFSKELRRFDDIESALQWKNELLDKYEKSFY
ncbi:STAS/SEC14 domain-containing protein [Aquimarina sp. MMG015]|uniref:STAS/SEC14 domain-containing protein n=1 Tax=Aquimarina TaxID=290174 RepID=UPI00041280A8|nr:MULTISPECIES: STAS/SEC14 domain-containing protein [Aquimarina]AXT55701.1 STAS/SEC14 domain-containing protein [Aquimarina sp. AD1]MBQ4804482.1 STAS/SEC14 domain-containing protein [Aquimarina sp. MMG015]RKN13033.1 STAS/SEC14 domain-containing protein [Aquimarina sp. AD1]